MGCAPSEAMKGPTFCCLEQPKKDTAAGVYQQDERDTAVDAVYYTGRKLIVIAGISWYLARSGMHNSGKYEKWLPASALHGEEFAALHLPSNHIGFVGATWGGVMPDTDAARVKSLIDCDAICDHVTLDDIQYDENFMMNEWHRITDFQDTRTETNATWVDQNLLCHIKGPCYPGLHILVSTFRYSQIFLPLFPVIAAMLSALFERRANDTRSFGTKAKEAISSKEGRRINRLAVYVLAVLFLQGVVMFKHRIYEAVGDTSMEFSSTIFLFLGGVNIAMREITHQTLATAHSPVFMKWKFRLSMKKPFIVVEKRDRPIFLTWVINFVIWTQMYYIFWTVRYFTFGEEMIKGYVAGAAFAMPFVLLTTSKWMMENVFAATPGKHYYEPMTKEKPEVKAREVGEGFGEPLLSVDASSSA